MIKKIMILSLVLFSGQLFSKEKFSSSYLDFSKDCKSESIEGEEGDAPLICEAPGNYLVTVTYSACFETVVVESKDRKEVIQFGNQPIGTADKRKMEWRMSQNKPIGIIYRMEIMKSTPDENCPEQKTGKERLEIRGLGKYSKLSKSVNSGKKANEKAREILDSYVSKKK